MVGGVHRPYNQTLAPALKVLGTQPGVTRVSGVYAMLFEDRKIFFGDCTVNVEPDAATLAEIAINTARVAESFGVTPRVAMLSFSDFGEHYGHPSVARVREAVERVRAAWPDLEIDGEMQADTAVDPAKIREAFPFSTLRGPANVLIFPDLQSGNIAYKLLVQLAAAEALGPLLAGLAAPASVIPTGAAVSDVVNVATWTAVQALERRRLAAQSV
jgi:malate dehydrogenase (oxaloacetate-decarboxylating)(NADP+)